MRLRLVPHEITARPFSSKRAELERWLVINELIVFSFVFHAFCKYFAVFSPKCVFIPQRFRIFALASARDGYEVH